MPRERRAFHATRKFPHSVKGAELADVYSTDRLVELLPMNEATRDCIEVLHSMRNIEPDYSVRQQ